MKLFCFAIRVRISLRTLLHETYLFCNPSPDLFKDMLHETYLFCNPSPNLIKDIVA